ncbi:hypothetical protein Murru_2439 [Allomuricauda ruestringensis DSM 13258]|uniref:Uncharacterized protein n=1 Tax=Allomuricauda ruestringensis (strain DSM 13258 / CIP 107369 / LMG 19739 / B1) TaxID=886377 RepID=G2PPH6_ALLRU|nr:hypothetical protein Murru_2439 [Allomuricauda ruestringensis DSM 13258]
MFIDKLFLQDFIWIESIRKLSLDKDHLTLYSIYGNSLRSVWFYKKSE